MVTVIFGINYGALAQDSSKTVYLYNIHTGEYLKETYWEKGSYNQEALNRINYILRDFRVNEVKQIDLDLIDLLYIIKSILDAQNPIHVISGYRSTRTNEFLRKVSTGVASRSLHTQGKAIDIHIPGIPLERLRDTAINLKAGGVGFYPSSNFVHIDTGKFRVW
ncbi:MAG: DUF882 domain-containing protein [Hydrogenothermaceae bacterium]|nr:DUF882 domain-containing protein [Hydrogenothermaceae bacterium]